MYVTKEEAKRIIDKTNGKIWIDSFNSITFIHTMPKKITNEEGKMIICNASIIDYQDNEFFGLLSMDDNMQNAMTHNIKFPLIFRQ